jgi:hypothetical protein
VLSNGAPPGQMMLINKKTGEMRPVQFDSEGNVNLEELDKLEAQPKKPKISNEPFNSKKQKKSKNGKSSNVNM